jgi:hypothetical protein
MAAGQLRTYGSQHFFTHVTHYPEATYCAIQPRPHLSEPHDINGWSMVTSPSQNCLATRRSFYSWCDCLSLGNYNQSTNSQRMAGRELTSQYHDLMNLQRNAARGIDRHSSVKITITSF